MAWREGEIDSIYKQREGSDPANCRPIALLLNFRKIIERALESEVRGKYKFHDAQFGFQHGVGTETSILKTFQFMKNGLKCAAVLDLKVAYEKVPPE